MEQMAYRFNRIMTNRFYEVLDFIKEDGGVVGVRTSRGDIRAPKIGMAVAGSTSTLAGKAGLGKLPIETHKLQAFVSEPIKPLIDHVIESHAPLIDYVKFGWCTGLVMPGLDEKIDVMRRHDIGFWFGVIK